MASIFSRRRQVKLLPDLLKSCGILIICTGIGMVFYLLGLSEANIISIYILGILCISSLTWARMWGLLSSVVGVLLFNCLFAVPRFTLFVYDPQYSITIVVMLAASLVTSSIMTQFRRQLVKEKREAKRWEILLGTSQSLQQAPDEQGILTVTARQLNQLLKCPLVLYPLSDNLCQEPIVEGKCCHQDWLDDLDLEALLCWAGKGAVEPPPLSINRPGTSFFPIRGTEYVLAVVMARHRDDDSIDVFQRNIVTAMLDQAALALEKHRLRTHSEQIARQAEAERLRASLLRTVSHDLRTPLTGIAGNADFLLSQGEELSPHLRRQMTQSIVEDAQWLIGLIENLLFVTRMENGSMTIHTQPELLQEILPEALHHMGKRIQHRPVSLTVSDELLMVQADARLLLQVIINLVDNAIKHTPADAAISLSAKRQENDAVVEVSDTGPGIPLEERKRVFDLFYTGGSQPGDSRRGIGLGLSLCQAIIQAHKGEITVGDNTPHGAVIRIKLKLEEIHIEGDNLGDRG